MVAVGLSVQGRGLVRDRLRRQKSRHRRKKRKSFVRRINRNDRICIKEQGRSQAGNEGNRSRNQLKNENASGARYLFSTICSLILALDRRTQSRRSARGNDRRGHDPDRHGRRASDKKTDPIKPENLSLYENGIEQKIKNFTFDPSPSKIVILVDNSQTLPTSVEAYEKGGDGICLRDLRRRPAFRARLRRKGRDHSGMDRRREEDGNIARDVSEKRQSVSFRRDRSRR